MVTGDREGRQVAMQSEREQNRRQVRGGWLTILIMTGALAAATGCHARRPEIKTVRPQPAAPLGIARAADKHEALGDEYYRRNRLGEARAEWRLALELDPRRTALARRIEEAEDGTAADAAATGVAAAAEDLELNIAKELRGAERCYRLSRLQEAELAWRSILEMEQGNTTAAAGLRRLQEEAYQADSGRAFDRTTEELYHEGMLAYRRQDWAAAESKLAEAANLNPEQTQVREFLRRTRGQLARLRDQERAARLAAQAQAAEQARCWGEAHRLWQEAARMQPPPAAAAEGVSRTAQALAAAAAVRLRAADQAWREGRCREALAGYENVLELLPEQPEALAGAARARRRLNAQKQAVDARAAAQQHYAAGAALERKGDWSGALREWETASAADPQNTALKAEVARMRARESEAKEQIRRRAQARYEDGLAAYQRGELNLALTAWKETLELDPAHEKASTNLKRIEQEMK